METSPSLLLRPSPQVVTHHPLLKNNRKNEEEEESQSPPLTPLTPPITTTTLSSNNNNITTTTNNTTTKTLEEEEERGKKSLSNAYDRLKHCSKILETSLNFNNVLLRKANAKATTVAEEEEEENNVIIELKNEEELTCFFIITIILLGLFCGVTAGLILSLHFWLIPILIILYIIMIVFFPIFTDNIMIMLINVASKIHLTIRQKMSQKKDV